MRIAFVIYGSLDEVSGGFLYDRQLINILQQRGHQVQVIAWPWRSYGRSLFDNISFGVMGQLKRDQVDLIIQDQLVHPSCFYLNQRLNRSIQTPIVSLIHLLRSSQPWPNWQRRLYHAVERHYLSTVAGFIFVNKHIKARVHTILGSRPPGVIAPPAGDHLVSGGLLTADVIGRRSQYQGPLKIIFVGNITPLKGLHLLLEGLSQLSAKSWRLTVLGSVDRDLAYVGRIRRYIKARNWEDQVIFRGVVSHAEVNIALSQHDVFAVPSNPESYSIAYLEAMSHGLPVVADAQSDSADLIDPGNSGFHVQSGDAAGLAAALNTLARDRDQLVRMSLAARERFLTLPTWDQSMYRAALFLEQLVANT